MPTAAACSAEAEAKLHSLTPHQRLQALRFERRVAVLGFDPGASFVDRCGRGEWSLAATPDEAVSQIKEFLERPTT